MAEPTKTREGGQPLPTPGRECVQDALIALIEERKQLGIQRYGSPLMTHNGRSAIRDALEESLDLTVYLMQVEMEMADQKAELEQLRAIVARVRSLHQSDPDGRSGYRPDEDDAPSAYGPIAQACQSCSSRDLAERSPCETLRALDAPLEANRG